MVSAATLSGCMGFRLAPCLVIWDFGWPSVWFYGISKLTDGSLSRSQTPLHAQELLGLSCGGLTASDLLWASKLTDASLRPQTLPPLRLALAWFRLAPRLVLWGFGWRPVWLYGISAGPLSGFQTDGWPPVPISNPSPRPRAPWIELRQALAWFRLAPCLVLWAFQN